jgi:hypothetical protein
MVEVLVTIKSLASRMPSPEVIAKAGVNKIATPLSLAVRRPSPDIAAKVGGKITTPFSLAARMPSPEIAAKVGGPKYGAEGALVRRVHRRNAQA